MPKLTAHWEHGYRCHGLWQGNKRLALIGIGPRHCWNKQDGYSWSIDGTNLEGKEPTLKAAKLSVLQKLASLQQGIKHAYQ